MSLRAGVTTKDPDEELDYTIDWSRELGTDTIASSAWAFPSGIVEGSVADSFEDQTATVWVDGGTADTDYQIENTITTAGGKTLQAHMLIQVRG